MGIWLVVPPFFGPQLSDFSPHDSASVWNVFERIWHDWNARHIVSDSQAPLRLSLIEQKPTSTLAYNSATAKCVDGLEKMSKTMSGF